MDDLMTRYNDLKEKRKRIDEIKKQIELCVSINMSQPKLIRNDGSFQFYELRIIYSGKEFLIRFHTILGKIDLLHIKDQIVQHILKWELKERGIEYPPRLER